MHFKTLVTVEIPDTTEIDTQNNTTREVVELLDNNTSKENKCPSACLNFIISSIESTHFINSTIEAVDEIMAPYSQDTDVPEYIEFIDCTKEVQSDFEECIDCLKLLEGKIVEHMTYPYYNKYSICNGKVYQKDAGPLKHEKRTKKAKKITALTNYPRKKLHKTFEEYVEKYHGYDFDEKHKAYGYYCNPNAMWDWYQIGGRWPAAFLVKDSCKEYFDGDRSWCNEDSVFKAPEGFRWVSASRKKDIEWNKMQEWEKQEATETFYRLEKMFLKGQIDGDFRGQFAEKGITLWGEYVYYKDESLDEYLERCIFPKKRKYPLGFCDIVDIDNWFNKNEIALNPDTGKFEKIDWENFIDEYIDNLDDDTVLVCVDYHM
ncbi:MAG: hypothetical protein NC177_17605 [Ruminococcus flavefaciens]|nr:hypothetical protein [Ruminococcus flavefaciens]